MPNDKNKSTVDFLNDLGDTSEVFKEEVVPSLEDEKEMEDVEEKPLPFHKDPKVQRYVEKQIEKALKDVKPSAEREFRQEVENINLPASFVKLVGNDTEEKKQVLKDLSDYFGGLKGEARNEFLAEMQAREQQQVEEDNAAAAELDEAFETIEETYDVDLSSNAASAKQLRTQFIEYVRKIAPKNEQGEVAAFPDMTSAFESFQEMSKRPANNGRAKELASRGMTRSSDTSTELPKTRTWKDIDRYFETLNSKN